METMFELVGFLIEHDLSLQNDSTLVPWGKFRIREDFTSKLSDRNILAAYWLNKS